MWTELMDLFPEMKDPDLLKDICCKHAFNRKAVIFCMTARVGSTALLSLLRNNYGFPFIEEIFNGRGVAPQLIKANSIATFEEYLVFFKQYIPRNMLFTFKTSWSDFAWCVDSNITDLLFPNADYIYLDRIDIDAQAVSLYCAMLSGQWHKVSGERFERNSEIAYEKEKIDRIVWNLQHDKLKWQKFFDSKDIMPTTIIYEAIIKSPKGAIQRLIRDLNLNGEANSNWAGGAIEKIVDAKQENILQRYRRERYAGIYGLPPIKPEA